MLYISGVKLANYLTKRGDVWHYFRRRPAHMQRLERRKLIVISLKTADESEARRRAIIQNEMIENYWADLIRNPGLFRDEKYREAVARARTYGFAYKTIASLSQGPLHDLVSRMLTIADQPQPQRKRVAEALAGDKDAPEMPLSQCLDIYFGLIADRVTGRSQDFLRKFKNPRIRVVNHFIQAVGDKDVFKIERKDIISFRAWWMERIVANKMRPETANKDFMHLKDIISVVALHAEKDIDAAAMFSKLHLKSAQKARAAFEAEFVRDKILADGVLDELNDEARALIYIVADTGARPSEIIGLRPEDIFLDAPVPYIDIRHYEGHGLKTSHSARQIPLVGFALTGARMVKDGFKRYKIADSAGNLINAYLERRGLLPSPDHSLYSLRHTFKDRLRDAGAPEEIIDSLMGHKTRGPKYGRGHLLTTKKKWLDEIKYKI